MIDNNVTANALTIAQAIRLHDEFASRSDLAFNYFYDGCAQRTHLIGMDNRLKSLSLKKAWAFAHKRDYLTYTAPNGFKQQWHYHMALSAPVTTPNIGRIYHLIFDPALFDAPVTMPIWRNSIANQGSEFFMLEWGAYPERARGDFSPAEKTSKDSTAQAEKILKDYTAQLDFPQRIVASSPLKREFAKSVSCPREYENLFKGNGWISEVLFKHPTPS